MKQERIAEKIRKLLQLAQSPNVHEAAAAAAKAQQLLAEYNLSMESVLTEEAPQQAQTIYTKTRQRLEDWAYSLGHTCAEAFDCRYYHQEYEGKTVFVGVGADAEVCAWMYGYLYKTLLRLASTHMRSSSCSRLRVSKSKRQARNSFLFGAVMEITNRLSLQKQSSPVTSQALVPVKNEIIQAAMPKLHTSEKINTGPIREDDWIAGRQAASSVPFSTPVQGTGTPLATLA